MSEAPPTHHLTRVCQSKPRPLFLFCSLLFELNTKTERRSRTLAATSLASAALTRCPRQPYPALAFPDPDL